LSGQSYEEDILIGELDYFLDLYSFEQVESLNFCLVHLPMESLCGARVDSTLTDLDLTASMWVHAADFSSHG
jgi:hypothetical protein